jgi:hypothetical protein
MRRPEEEEAEEVAAAISGAAAARISAAAVVHISAAAECTSGGRLILGAAPAWEAHRTSAGEPVLAAHLASLADPRHRALRRDPVTADSVRSRRTATDPPAAGRR